jgi:hypothetical protein
MRDLNEKLAQEAAELINGGEWRDGKWYSDGQRDAWRRALKPAADRIEKLEAALREISQTFTAQVETKPEQWINKMTAIMSHEQAVEAYKELGRRIVIARKALEGKYD